LKRRSGSSKCPRFYCSIGGSLPRNGTLSLSFSGESINNLLLVRILKSPYPPRYISGSRQRR
jgi:hypothetical protein